MRFDLELQLAGSMLQCVVGRVMGTKFGVEVAQDPNADGIGHVGILINAAGSAAGNTARREVKSLVTG